MDDVCSEHTALVDPAEQQRAVFEDLHRTSQVPPPPPPLHRFPAGQPSPIGPALDSSEKKTSSTEAPKESRFVASKLSLNPSVYRNKFDERHLNVVRGGVRAVQEWIERTGGESLQLSGANLAGFDLKNMNLAGAKLVHADLSGARLDRAILRGADLRECNFQEASLWRATLDGANMCESILLGANLSGASMKSTAIGNSYFAFTSLCAVDLSDVIGLESCVHLSPSSVGVDTIVMSSRGIAKEFLRGCAVPEALIQMANSEIGNAGFVNPCYSCFLSHSSADQEFCDQLYSRLSQQGVQVWMDRHSMMGGSRVSDQIIQAISNSEKLIIVLSKHSLESPWVRGEVTKAFSIQKQENKSIIFPISMLPAEEMHSLLGRESTSWPLDLVEEIRSISILDFSKWTESAEFGRMVDRMVKSLFKAESRGFLRRLMDLPLGRR